MYKGWTAWSTHGPKDDDGSFKHSHHIEFWKQPWRRWIVYRIYHWYDMRLFKVPGMRWIDRHTGGRSRDEYGIRIPWFAKQDIRCWHLEQKGRVVLMRTGITEQQYEELTGKPCDL